VRGDRIEGAKARRRPTRPWSGRSDTGLQRHASKGTAMKVLLWIVLVIFLIGLAVVLGLGKLIF